MKKNVFHALVFCTCSLAACAGPGFTPAERELIGTNSEEGIMRQYVVENPEDSLLLRQQSRTLTTDEIASPEYAVLKERMLSTVLDSTNTGVGIAAPQVGVSVRLIAVQRFDKKNRPFEFYANPRIVHYSQTCKSGPEGCLSVPGQRGEVLRSDTIVLEYADEASMATLRDTVCGFTAVIFQHETDHLDGVLYTDKLYIPEESATERRLRESGYTELTEAIPGIKVRLVYATQDNFMKQVLYDDLHKAFLVPEAAEKLARAQQTLQTKKPGHTLLVWDAARPFSIQKKMRAEAVKRNKAYYVADPAKGGGLHNYGAAVDLTILGPDGAPLPMGSPYDFFGPEANTDKETTLLASGKITREELDNRLLLRRVMTGAGFTTVTSEWWHFNHVKREVARETLNLIE